MRKYVWLAAISLSSLLIACGGLQALKNLPDTKATTDSLANIKGSADRIDKAAGDKVPEVKPETAVIRNEAAKLAKTNEQTKMLEKNLIATQHALKQEQEKGNSLIRHCIALAYGLGILAVAVGFFLRAPSVVLGGVGGLVGAAVASWVFAWAWAIGLVCLCGAGAYYLFVQRKALAQVVATTEVVKTTLNNGAPEATHSLFRAKDSVANSIQSSSTQKIVKGIRRRLGFAAAKVAPSPTTSEATNGTTRGI